MKCLHVVLWFLFVAVTGHADDPAPVGIDFFYEEGCSDCTEVRSQILPQLEPFGREIEVRSHDINEKTNFLKLVHFQDTLGITENENVCMVVDGKHALNGLGVIRTGLVERVEKSLAQSRIDAKSDSGSGGPAIPPVEILTNRASQWTPWVVAGAGLVDGLNPCAISTLVFFMSLLVVGQVRGRQLVLMGLSCASDQIMRPRNC